MYLIVGLGNPGPEYSKTRHNLGYQVINYLAEDFEVTNLKQKFKGLIGSFKFDQQTILLCEPLTYMNNSGECVAAIKNYYKIPDDHIIIIYDDIDIPLGTVRVRQKGGPGTHNGMRSVVNCLKTKDFPRIRIGVGPVPENKNLIDFVLSRFSKEEEKVIESTIKLAARAVILIISKGIQQAMNETNKKDLKE